MSRPASPVQTEDLSYTLYSERFGEHYHSIFGARSESMHVFIEAGLRSWLTAHQPRDKDCAVSVLEIGFGTGLNAWLTAMEAQRTNTHIIYEGIELFPVDPLMAQVLYPTPTFKALHFALWEEMITIDQYFSVYKRNADILTCSFSGAYDLVYFDAFSPNVQPELWSEEVFTRIFSAMTPGGILTTYCAKGDVRRAMQRSGFSVEKIPGPKGKREMVRAYKR